MKRSKLFTKFLFCLLLTSCIVPESTHVAPEFYLLSSSKKEKVKGLENVSFFIREVELPSYLIDNRLIFRPDEERLEFRENIRWGEPLEEGIGRVVGQNLSDLTGSLQFSVFPHRQKIGCKWEVGLTIIRFEKISSEMVYLKCLWNIQNTDGFSSTASYDEKFPIKGITVRDEVQAMCAALSSLSGTITEAILTDFTLKFNDE